MNNGKQQVEITTLPKLLQDFIEGAKCDVKQASKEQQKGDGFDLNTCVATFTIDLATIGRCIEYRYDGKDKNPCPNGAASTTGSADGRVQGAAPASTVKIKDLFLEDLDPAAFRHHNCRVYLLNLLAMEDLWKTDRVCTCNA